MRAISILCAVFLLVSCQQALAQTTYTPDEYKVTLYEVALSTDGVNFQAVLSDATGIVVDIADASSFTSAFASSAPVVAGNYSWIRMIVDEDLVWSHPDPPVSMSNQTFTVPNGPAGPLAGQLAVHFATHDQGGRPEGQGGGNGTVTNPFLLGQEARIAGGGNTTLRIVFAVTNTLVDQGGSVYDLAPPRMFFVSENGTVSSLSGTFNTALYNVVKEFSSDGMGGFTVTSWSYQSGHGTLTFDGAGSWTWSGTTNDFDLQGGGTGSLNTSASITGRYGVNEDGSIWMIATGQPGTLRGAISSDGNMVVATMFDSPSSHLMIFGVAQATSAAASKLNTGYYFTTYGTDYNSGTTQLEYRSAFGVVTGDGLGGVTGTFDVNRMTITNPTASTPTFTGPTTVDDEAFADTLTINANGTLVNAGTDLQGGVLENGDAACFATNFNSSYTDENRFGFLVRQSTAGTFTTASLNGTYFGGHFGDGFDNGAGVNPYFSGFFTVVFNGAGSATVTTLENREGVIAANTFAQEYTVDSSTGVVTFNDPGSSGSGSIKGAIGPNATSFILTAETMVGSTESNQRFLGLGLKQ